MSAYWHVMTYAENEREEAPASSLILYLVSSHTSGRYQQRLEKLRLGSKLYRYLLFRYASLLCSSENNTLEPLQRRDHVSLVVCGSVVPVFHLFIVNLHFVRIRIFILILSIVIVDTKVSDAGWFAVGLSGESYSNLPCSRSNQKHVELPYIGRGWFQIN